MLLDQLGEHSNLLNDDGTFRSWNSLEFSHDARKTAVWLVLTMVYHLQ